MSFTWSCYDQDGNDLFLEYHVTRGAWNLGPSRFGDTQAPHGQEDFRALWRLWTAGPVGEYVARGLMEITQEWARQNAESLLREPHCETCTCPCCPGEPDGWSIDEINRLLAIPLTRVARCEVTS
jgi:hypothetical protein